MKKYIFLTAAIAAFSSCSSDNDPIMGETGKQALTFTATIEDAGATRATYNTETKKAEWQVNDQISINGKVYKAMTAGAATTFEKESDEATADGEGKYKAYFPASLYNGTTATLPATQTYTTGKFDMPMYAESTNTTLEFKNLCAILAVKVTSDDIATLKSIKVKADQKLNGSFTVSDNKAVIGSDGTNELVLASSESLTLSSEGTTFYIAIPAQDYKYLNIYLSADGTTYKEAMATKKATGLGAVARSTMFNIDYAKNAVQLWASGPYFATMNIGAASETDYGGYYAWGGSQDKVDDDNTGTDALTGDADTATKLWGSAWRMPTQTELQALLDNCDVEWTTLNGVNGRKFTGNGDYASNSVFLPAAGYCDYGNVYDQGRYGDFWSSTPNGSNYACCLFFSSGYKYVADGYRGNGFSVRAVLKE